MMNQIHEIQLGMKLIVDWWSQVESPHARSHQWKKVEEYLLRVHDTIDTINS